MSLIRPIMNRLKELSGTRTDGELADWLGCKINTLRTWYQRDTMDWELFIHRTAGMDMNYLLRGIRSAQSDLGTGYELANDRIHDLEVQLQICKDIIRELASGKEPASSYAAGAKKTRTVGHV